MIPFVVAGGIGYMLHRKRKNKEAMLDELVRQEEEAAREAAQRAAQEIVNDTVPWAFPDFKLKFAVAMKAAHCDGSYDNLRESGVNLPLKIPSYVPANKSIQECVDGLESMTEHPLLNEESETLARYANGHIPMSEIQQLYDAASEQAGSDEERVLLQQELREIVEDVTRADGKIKTSEKLFSLALEAMLSGQAPDTFALIEGQHDTDDISPEHINDFVEFVSLEEAESRIHTEWKETDIFTTLPTGHMLALRAIDESVKLGWEYDILQVMRHCGAKKLISRDERLNHLDKDSHFSAEAKYSHPASKGGASTNYDSGHEDYARTSKKVLAEWEGIQEPKSMIDALLKQKPWLRQDRMLRELIEASYSQNRQKCFVYEGATERKINTEMLFDLAIKAKVSGTGAKFNAGAKREKKQNTNEEVIKVIEVHF